MLLTDLSSLDLDISGRPVDGEGRRWDYVKTFWDVLDRLNGALYPRAGNYDLFRMAKGVPVHALWSGWLIPASLRGVDFSAYSYVHLIPPRVSPFREHDRDMKVFTGSRWVTVGNRAAVYEGYNAPTGLAVSAVFDLVGSDDFRVLVHLVSDGVSNEYEFGSSELPGLAGRDCFEFHAFVVADAIRQACALSCCPVPVWGDWV